MTTDWIDPITCPHGIGIPSGQKSINVCTLCDLASLRAEVESWKAKADMVGDAKGVIDDLTAEVERKTAECTVFFEDGVKIRSSLAHEKEAREKAEHERDGAMEREEVRIGIAIAATDRAEKAEGALQQTAEALCNARNAAALAVNHLHAANDVKERVWKSVVDLLILPPIVSCPHEARVKELEEKYRLIDAAYKTMGKAYEIAFDASQKAESLAQERQVEIERVREAELWFRQNVNRTVRYALSVGKFIASQKNDDNHLGSGDSIIEAVEDSRRRAALGK